MDASGWPDTEDVYQLLRAVADDNEVTSYMVDELPGTLRAVIADFESPYGRNGIGGTNRSFTPTVGTKVYDGNGYPELRVADIVPNTTLTVTAFDTTLIDVALKENRDGLGWNVLYRPQSAGAILGTSYGLSGLFPLGKQNIRVTTTWGFAAQVPADLWEAVRCEVARRILVKTSVGLSGVGDQVKMGPFQVDTAVGAPAWTMSSPLAVFATQYQNTIIKYRETKTWRLARLAGRMS